jgi:hypothetical protein
VTDTSCLAFEPIYFSGSLDTEETIQAILEHNAAWIALCEPEEDLR